MAAPFQDISSTSVSLEEEQTSPDAEHLTVKISRVDDLVDDNGDVLIERIMGVQLGFDIEDEKILLNGAPLELGPSSVEIEAVILADESLLPSNSSEEMTDLTPLTNTLDIGLVTVEVEATVERLVTSEGIPIRHIVVSERIVEVNGAHVLQTEAQQHVLDIFENGTVVQSIVASDATTTELGELGMLPEPAAIEAMPFADEDSPCGLRSRFAWFLKIDPHIRMAILGFFSGTLLYTFFVLARRIVRGRAHYMVVAVEDAEAIWSDEKDAKAVEVEETEYVEYVEEERKALLN